MRLTLRFILIVAFVAFVVTAVLFVQGKNNDVNRMEQIDQYVTENQPLPKSLLVKPHDNLNYEIEAFAFLLITGVSGMGLAFLRKK